MNSTPTVHPTLLIVDDERPVLAALARAARRHFGERLAVCCSADPHQALRWLSRHEADVVMSDLRMPGLDGITFLQRAGAIRPDAVRLMLTASADFDSAQQAINRTGVFRYLCKPWQDAELLDHLGAALTLALSRRAQREWALDPSAPSGTADARRLEALRLEALEPGITHVEWGPNGEVLMPPLADDGL